jgi:pimeloyl-ACP methyl ester carboxylesterase
MRFPRLFLPIVLLAWPLAGCDTSEPRSLIRRNDTPVGRDRQVQTSDILHYEIRGEGKPLILLHGFGENSYSWRHLIPKIPKGYKIFAIDLKGFGKSAKPLDERYSLHDQADLIYQFIKKHNLGPLSIIGHSMGGGVALLTAIKLAANGVRVSSLVLIDSIAYPQEFPAFISLLRTPLLNWLSVSIVPAEFQVRSILKLAYHDDSKITEDLVQAYAEPIKEPGGREALIATAKQIIPNDIDIVVKKYRSLAMPTLILWGKEDAIIPLKFGEQLHRVIPNSTFIVFKSCGHIPHEEVPEQSIKHIVEFLAKNQ